MMVTIILFVFSACAKDSPKKSTVDGISDEVYEQMLQHYFASKTTLKMLMGDDEELKEGTWRTEHELYDEAIENGKERDEHPESLFPNALFLDHFEDPEQFSETEQEYIEKLYEFVDAGQRANIEDYEALKKELVEELDIKESYNMFEEKE